jgi:hypothetical protein
MDEFRFKLELVGGPADGFHVALPEPPGRTVRMPASPAAAGSGQNSSHQPSTRLLALYDLASRQEEFGADAAPLVRLRYRFVGMRACDEGLPRPRTDWFGRLGLAWLFDRLTARFAKQQPVLPPQPEPVART